MKYFNKIILSFIIYFLFLWGLLSISGIIYSFKNIITPDYQIKNNFSQKIQIYGYYFDFPYIAYKKENKFYVKNFGTDNIILLTIFLIFIGSILFIDYIYNVIQNEHENAFLLRTTNLEALATQNSMTILTENIHHELNSPLKVIENNLKKFKKLMILYLSKKYTGEYFTSFETLKSYIEKNNIQIIEIANKKIRKKFFFDLFELTDTSIEQIQTILHNMAEFKQLRYSNGNKSIFDIAEGAGKILKVTVDISFDLEIDEELKKFKIDHNNGLKNADLINILINHFKNSIEANATQIEVFIENIKNNFLLLNIKDNGNGIPNEFISEIFSPNKSTKSDYVGLRGNGLFLNQNLLKQFGGDIKLKKTQEGKGTEFVLKIPIEKINLT